MFHRIVYHRYCDAIIAIFTGIVCTTIHDNRRQTRYFITHSYLFVLVQPDLALPNYGVVVELCPLRDVEVVARTDAKGLSLKLGPDRLLALNFEDKKRCSCLYEQLVTCRRRVKIEISGKLQQWILDV